MKNLCANRGEVAHSSTGLIYYRFCVVRPKTFSGPSLGSLTQFETPAATKTAAQIEVLTERTLSRPVLVQTPWTMLQTLKRSAFVDFGRLACGT